MGIFISLTAGITAGLVFFAGLLWTVKKLPDAKHPGLLSIFSFLARMLVTAGSLLVVLDGKWQNAFVYLAGFLLARTAVTFKMKKRGMGV